MRGRYTTAFYQKMGVDSAIADTREESAKTAGRLVHEADFKQNITTQFAENSEKLFGHKSTIREIESVWIAAVRERT